VSVCLCVCVWVGGWVGAEPQMNLVLYVCVCVCGHARACICVCAQTCCLCACACVVQSSRAQAGPRSISTPASAGRVDPQRHRPHTPAPQREQWDGGEDMAEARDLRVKDSERGPSSASFLGLGHDTWVMVLYACRFHGWKFWAQTPGAPVPKYSPSTKWPTRRSDKCHADTSSRIRHIGVVRSRLSS
jgi:hypothetical protein